MDSEANPPASTPAPTPAPPPKAARSVAWLFGLLPVLLVVGVVVGYLIWGPEGDDHGGLGGGGATPSEPEPVKVVAGRDYYVFVKTIELYPEQADGGTWDKLDGSAPDIRYSLSWQGHTGFTSDARDDTLIGVWDPITIDVKEALPMLGEGKLELRSTLNQGIILNVTDDQTLTINVWDQDPTGLGSDAAGQVVLNVADLLQGDQTLRFEASETNAIKRIVLGTTDTSQPLRSLIEALSSAEVPE
ncbi:MAG: hypothetical protein AAF333_14830 [Planctomycetota bacterium]